MRQFFTSRPIATSLVVVAGYFTILAAPAIRSSQAFGGDPSRSPQQAPIDQLVTEILLAASAVAIVFLLGWARQARLTSRPAWSGFWYVLVPTMITLVMFGAAVLIASQGEADFSALISSGLPQSILLLVLFVGVFEEVLFRGILLHGFELRIGPVAALFASSFVFGISHYVNWINGQSLAATHPQVIHAGLSGILYGAIALRTRSVWPGVLLHALWDFVVTMNHALIGDTFGTAADPTTSGAFVQVFGFLLRHFEPILGLIALAGWFRWQRRQVDQMQ
ncbi:membrane protease YdiL (CAAX protease family) [Aliiruegeria haliotis]|uniref:Membrane protease YdiL (CAAX protease family) n=1 Tax=Aliiruegeria haliotis TaxID=1280846 RepID=A0A2T0RG23_9RHOB|nr:membrane protease YdiL (CAAX protease family) [Aliiruegeria haliotis]